MRLLVPPRAQLSLGLLLLTLVLVAVCGLPKDISERSRNRPRHAEQGNVQAREDQQPQGSARNSSARLSANGILWSKPQNGEKVVAKDTLPVECRILEDTDDLQLGGSAEKAGMRSFKNQEQDPENPVTDKETDGDTCDKWMSCNGDFFLQYLKYMEQELPSCPCRYPNKAIREVVTIFDERLHSWFRWKDASTALDHIHVFYPSARLCLHSLLPENSSSLASQHCCYDDRLHLLTRGKGAGTPTIINPDYSPVLHFMVDRVPWITCKGDWSRYHKMLPPNNGLSCPERPSKRAYQVQLQNASKSNSIRSILTRLGIDWKKVGMNDQL